MSEKLTLREKTLKDHKDWVTSIAFCNDVSNTNPEVKRSLLLTASRDKSVLLWESYASCTEISAPRFALRGHNNFINEVAVSPDGALAATASSDKTIRIWDLVKRESIKILQGHKSDVTSVTFISDTMLASGSRDHSVKIWSVNGECLHTFEEAHSNWVSNVKAVLLSQTQKPLVISSGWDKKVKVWDLTSFREVMTCNGDSGYVNAVAVSQDGSICATGGKMGKIHLWDFSESKCCVTLDAGDVVNALCFSPLYYWLCAATNDGLKIWDISDGARLMEVIKIEEPNPQVENQENKMLQPQPQSLTWSDDGKTLFVGYTDNTVRMVQC